MGSALRPPHLEFRHITSPEMANYHLKLHKSQLLRRLFMTRMRNWIHCNENKDQPPRRNTISQIISRYPSQGFPLRGGVSESVFTYESSLINALLFDRAIEAPGQSSATTGRHIPNQIPNPRTVARPGTSSSDADAGTSTVHRQLRGITRFHTDAAVHPAGFD